MTVERLSFYIFYRNVVRSPCVWNSLTFLTRTTATLEVCSVQMFVARSDCDLNIPLRMFLALRV